MTETFYQLLLTSIIGLSASASARSQCFYEKLLAPDAGAADQFGVSADIDGERVIIGAHLHNDGQAYIYRFNGTA